MDTPTSKSRLEISSSSDPTNVVESQEDESTSDEEVAPETDASLGKEASTEMELPKDIKYDCSGTNPDTSIASPYGRDITDLLLAPYVSTQNAYGFTEGSGMELQNMYDNVQGNDETRYWESLISDASLGKEALTEMELPKDIKYDCSGANPDTSIASLYGRDITDLLLAPYVPTQNAYGFTEGSGMELQNMYDNVQGNDETRYWKSLISDASEILNCKSLNDSEVYKRLMMKRASTSEASGTGVGMQTMPPDLNNEPQCSDYEINSEAMKNSPRIDFAMSPKEKRVKLNPGEGKSWKLCNCKMSKCLKLYCECFTASLYCTDLCSCVDCFNKHIHKDTILATRKQIESKNPLAFAPHVIRSSDWVLEIKDDSSKTQARVHINPGCRCKQTNCLEKLCGCYKAGVSCCKYCRCEGCQNKFGRKDG